MKRIANLLLLAAVAWLCQPALAAVPQTTVKLNDVKQEIAGFGASGAFRQAEKIMYFPEPQRSEVLDTLFSPTKGAGLSVIRNIIGDSVLKAKREMQMAGNCGTIEPEEGKWDWSADADQIWLMKEAKKRGCTTFISAAWSSPAWMKTNNSVINGGNLKKDKYRAYAEYLAEYVNGYKKHHDLDIYAISPQNEPTFTGGYPCCQWSAQDFLELTKNHIIPVFQEKKVKAKYMLGEHMFWDEAFAVPSLNDPEACARVDIVAAHGYGAPNGFGVMPVATAKKKQIWETEVYNNAANFPDGGNSMDNALYWAEYIHNHMTVSQASGWLYWWLASTATFEGTFITLDAEVSNPDAAAYKSELVSRSTPNRSVNIDLDIKGARKLYLEVDIGNGKFDGDRADWFEPKIVGPKGEKKLTEIEWVTASAGYKAPLVDKNLDGDQGINVNGVKAQWGIATHAQSMIEYDLPEGYTRFKCKAGLDDLCLKETDPEASIMLFRVYTKDPTEGPKNATRKFKVYPRLWAVGNFSRFVRPGWVRVEATPSPAAGILTSAYKAPKSGEFAVVAINKNDAAQSVVIVIDGGSTKLVTPYRTSAKENLQKLEDVAAADGKITVTLAPKSVTTFVGKAK